MLLALLALGAAALSLVWNQRWSGHVFAAGLGMTTFLVASIYLNFAGIYNWAGINLYVVLFLAAILLFTGGFGLSVKRIRWLTSSIYKRPSVS